MVRFHSAQVDDRGVVELLSTAAGGQSGRPEAVMRRYRDDPTVALIAATVADRMVGVVGYEAHDDRIVPLHIATHTAHRRRGIARQLLTVVASRRPGRVSVAETDREIVGFYIALGYTATSLGQTDPGVERFSVCLRPDSAQ